MQFKYKIACLSAYYCMYIMHVAPSDSYCFSLFLLEVEQLVYYQVQHQYL